MLMSVDVNILHLNIKLVGLKDTSFQFVSVIDGHQFFLLLQGLPTSLLNNLKVSSCHFKNKIMSNVTLELY